MESKETWFLLRSGCRDAAWNMALDEALHRAAPELQRPVLRLYGWTEPAATFGYSQRYLDLERLTPLRPLIRRSTGGGLVPHDRDWTYTLVFPPGHSWYPLRARASYERTHTWLSAAFEQLGYRTQLAPETIPGAGQCFVGAEQFDLLFRGAKIAGAAQRRNRSGLLIQGSVQPPAAAPSRAAWEESLCAVAADRWAVRWESLDIAGALETTADSLATAKYATDAHNRRR